MPKKNLINGEQAAADTQPSVTEKGEPTVPESGASGAKPPTPKPKWLKVALISGGAFIALILLAGIFGTPSAEMVFKDSLDEMLQTKSVTISQKFSGSTAGSDAIKLESSNYLNMEDSKELTAKGTFSLDMTTDAIPMVAEAEYISVGGGNYIKFSELSSSSEVYGASFRQIESSIKDKWIKARDGDNFASLVSVPLDAITDVTALPYANLGDDTRKDIVAILQDEDSFTIVESAKVTVNGRSAYRYELEFDESKQAEVSKKLGDAVAYFKDDDPDSDDSAKIDTLELWVDIETKRFVKIEYSGTSKQGDITAEITFSNYDATMGVEKPDEYFVESELTQ